MRCGSLGHKESDTTEQLNCFPGGSAGKESACNMGDLGSVLGSWRREQLFTPIA